MGWIGAGPFLAAGGFCGAGWFLGGVDRFLGAGWFLSSAARCRWFGTGTQGSRAGTALGRPQTTTGARGRCSGLLWLHAAACL